MWKRFSVVQVLRVCAVSALLVFVLVGCAETGDGASESTQGFSSSDRISQKTVTVTLVAVAAATSNPTLAPKRVPLATPALGSVNPTVTVVVLPSSTAMVVGTEARGSSGPLPTTTPVPVVRATAMPTPTATAIPVATATPIPTPTLAPTAVPSPTPDPSDFVLRLPFEIGDVYDAGARSLGEVSFAGEWVVVPFGGVLGQGVSSHWVVGNNPDIWFELVPETVLTASVAGRVTAQMNPISTTPEGDVYDSHDWEVHITIGDGPYFLVYDHLVELQVVDGQFVEVGDPIGRATPASIRHGGSVARDRVEEIEWGLREATPSSAIGWCPFGWLPESDQVKLMGLLDVMRGEGRVVGDSVCLVERLED